MWRGNIDELFTVDRRIYNTKNRARAFYVIDAEVR